MDMRIGILLLYLASIVVANVVTARFAPLEFGLFLVPAGSVFIGATFILRDFVQQAIGRTRTYGAICGAMLLSAATSWGLGDTLWITAASAVTFLVSESTDTEIYSRLRLPMAWRVLYSGFAGGVIDSVLFVLIGLSPLGAGILPWEAVGSAILGQLIVKTGMQAAGAALVRMLPVGRTA
jgi:hypothetical protein